MSARAFATLVRRDAAMRLVPGLVLFALAVGAFAAWMQRSFHGTSVDDPSSLLALAPVMQIAFFALFVVCIGEAAPAKRATEHQLALPVSARGLVAARLGAVALTGALVLLAAVLLPAATGGSPPFRLAVVRFAAGGLLVWTAWAVAAFAWRPAAPWPERWCDSTIPLVAGLALGAFALAAPRIALPVCALLLFVGSGVLYASVPRTMQLDRAPDRRRGRATVASRGPSAAQRAEPVSERALVAGSSGRSPLRRWMLRRTALTPGVVVVGITLSALAAMTWGIAAGAFAFALALGSHTMIQQASQILREAAHLPLARRRIAPWVLLPPLVSIGLGVAASEPLRLFLYDGPTHLERVDLRIGRAGGVRTVQVPARLQRLRAVGDPLVVESPWGERVALDPLPLFPGCPVGTVHPYGIERGSSIEFVSWQISRAVRDAYRVEVAPDEVRERYLSILNGEVIGHGLGTMLLWSHPDVSFGGHRLEPFLALAITMLAWFVAGLHALRPGAPPASPARWWRARVLRPAAAAAVAVAYTIAVMTLTADLPFNHGFRLGTLANEAEQALGVTAAGVFAAVSIAALLAYWVLARRFARIEPPPPIRWSPMRGFHLDRGRAS